MLTKQPALGIVLAFMSLAYHQASRQIDAEKCSLLFYISNLSIFVILILF